MMRRITTCEPLCLFTAASVHHRPAEVHISFSRCSDEGALRALLSDFQTFFTCSDGGVGIFIRTSPERCEDCKDCWTIAGWQLSGEGVGRPRGDGKRGERRSGRAGQADLSAGLFCCSVL